MRKIIAAVSGILFLLLVTELAPAEEIPVSDVLSSEETVSVPIDWSVYTYEELVELNRQLDARILEMERQYAIENGNRIIDLGADETTLFLKQSLTLLPEVTRVVDEAPEKTVFTYTSSDPSVVSVTPKGVITAKAEGDAVITCTASDDEFIFAEITVHAVTRVSEVEISESAVTLLLKGKDPAAAMYDLSADPLPESAYCRDLVWTSSNEEIALVDQTGHVTALKPGTVTISATSCEEPAAGAKPKFAVCKVTVQEAVSEIGLSDTELILNKGKTAALKATVLNETATVKKVTWESADPSVVTVSATGALTAKGCGTADVICSAADGSGVTASCKVTVIQMVTGIRITEKPAKAAYLTLNQGSSLQLTASVLPEDATEPALIWESDAPDIVSVAGDGTIRAVGGGSANITAKATDGSEKTAVLNVYVPSISVTAQEYTVTSKSGMSFDFDYYGSADSLSVTSASTLYYGFELTRGTGSRYTIKILPVKAGKAILTLKDKDETKSTVKITINVDHSACYDKVSYPKAVYKDILRDPDSHDGKKYSIYGKVLQKGESWGSVYLRVGTTSYYYDSVFYITYYAGDIDVTVIEDDFITVYGECTGTKTYESIWGASITIPSMEAEKITIGRK